MRFNYLIKQLRDIALSSNEVHVKLQILILIRLLGRIGVK